MGCHAITAADKPEGQKLHRYWNDKRPIAWRRVHRVRGFVHFPHTRHVLAGVACRRCHGTVETMAVVEQVEPLTMGWCVDCQASRLAPRDCVVCHH